MYQNIPMPKYKQTPADIAEENTNFLEKFQAVSDDLSLIYWSDLSDNEDYYFEFVCLGYAKDHSSRFETAYTRFIFLSQYDINDPPITKNEMMLIDIPLKTMINAMTKLPLRFKTLFNPGFLGQNNLLIKFHKCKRDKIKITNVERIEITEDQKIKAIKYYELAG